MGTTAAIIAAGAIAGGGAIGASALQGGAGGVGVTQIPQTREARALQQFMARVFALNVGNKGPSFLDFLDSGGTAQFELANPGFLPGEAAKLGIITPGGDRPPYIEPDVLDKEGLSPEQLLFLGQEQRKERAKARIRNKPFPSGESTAEKYARFTGKEKNITEKIAKHGSGFVGTRTYIDDYGIPVGVKRSRNAGERLVNVQAKRKAILDELGLS